MSKKKFKTLDREEEDQEIPQAMQYEGICLQCAFFSTTPEWFGPHCDNPNSPFHRARKSENGTCVFGEYRAETAVPSEETVPEDGLYDVDPGTIRHDPDVVS